jgi:hypothetical protein
MAPATHIHTFREAVNSVCRHTAPSIHGFQSRDILAKFDSGGGQSLN